MRRLTASRVNRVAPIPNAPPIAVSGGSARLVISGRTLHVAGGVPKAPCESSRSPLVLARALSIAALFVGPTTTALELHHLNENWRDDTPSKLVAVCLARHPRGRPRDLADPAPRGGPF